MKAVKNKKQNTSGLCYSNVVSLDEDWLLTFVKALIRNYDKNMIINMSILFY